MTIALFASEPHYAAHLQPIAEALDLPILERRIDVTAEVVIVASRKDSRSFPNVVMVEHGAGQRYGSNAGGADTPEPQVKLFLAPSQRVADQDAPIYPNARRVGIGSPRVEWLSKLERNPQSPVIAFHWQSGIASESRSAWPHYQKALHTLNGVIGHGHPRMIRRLLPFYKKAGIRVEWDWAACVKVASVLACDNSSIIYEACALGIPVVLMDAPWYSKDWGLRFWEFADVGPRVSQGHELAPAIEAILAEDRWSERRAEAARYVYGMVEGSTQRAVSEILSL